MPQKQHSINTNQARRLACLPIISMLLGACQVAPGSAANAALPAPETASASATTPATQPATPAASAVTPSIQPALPTHTLETAPAPSVTGESTSASPTSGIPSLTASPFSEGVSIPAGNVIMPILMYHHISDKIESRYTTHIKAFREQMKTLKEEGYETVTISQLGDVIRSGGVLPKKPVAITFDDGYLDIYENAFPILREMGFTGSVYIITGTLGTDQSYGYMQEDALKELIAAGWEVGSHSVTHTDLRKTKLGAGNEMKQSKEDLETKLGIMVRSFSYPFAVTNQDLKDLAEKMGYDAAVGIDIINTHTPKRLYFLSRREVYENMPLSDFARLLVPNKNDDLIATQSAYMTETPAP